VYAVDLDCRDVEENKKPNDNTGDKDYKQLQPFIREFRG